MIDKNNLYINQHTKKILIQINNVYNISKVMKGVGSTYNNVIIKLHIMEKQGLLKLECHDDNMRCKVPTLTEKGQKIRDLILIIDQSTGGGKG